MTRRQLLLHLLREADDRGVTTGEIMRAGVGSRYGARLLELREEGHVVEVQRIRDGSFRYTLTRDAERGVETQTTAARSLHAPAASHEGQGNDSALDADTPTLFDVGRSTAAGSSYRDADAA